MIGVLYISLNKDEDSSRIIEALKKNTRKPNAIISRFLHLVYQD
jgi:hypothetical protein